MLVTAFILGLTGSLHCVGMCGPIALMIGGSKSLLLNRILYNLGRTITYTAMGMLVGLFGKIFQWGGVQGKISIALGLLTLLLLFLPTLQARLQPSLTPMMLKLKEIFAARLQSKRLVSSLTSGIVNGFLPCGLVYAALTIALVQPSLLESAGVMMLFGLGTIPMLLAAAYSWQTVKQWIPIASYKLQTAMLVIVAVVMIWRGLSVELNSGNNYRVTECNTHAYSEF